MRPRILIAALGLSLATGSVAAQPSVDIHLVDFQRQDDGTLTFGEPRNLTARPGYDNQPAFLPDGSAILYTSIHDSVQADVYRCELESGEIQRVTDTPESEYSPTPIAGGSRFSTVRVEMDQTQRLWSFDMDGQDARLLLPAVQPVGYHAWGSGDRLALFVLGEPHSLHLATVGSDSSTQICGDIGRSLQPMPGGELVSFLQRRVEGEDEEWWIRSVNSADGQLADLVRAPEGAVDHAWSPWGSVFMTADGTLLEWTPGTEGWDRRADFAGRGLRGLTRLAFHPSEALLVLVAEEAARE